MAHPLARGRDPRSTEVARLARDQGGVASRRQLYSIGITRSEIRAHVRGGRWQRVGDQSVALHNSELSAAGHRWAAVFQGGPRACLDGASSLVASGLERYDVDRVRVSVPRGARVRRTRRYDIRQTRRWYADDVVPSGVPRARVPVAAVRAAVWATTDRQAVHVLTMTVQQGLTTPEAIGRELLRLRRDKRRRLLHAVVNDLLDGARALGELDVLRELRRRGLPTPTNQVLRHDRRGRYYLDLYWPAYRLVVEVDGVHHSWAENVVGDALRQNALALAGDRVLRLPLLGLRLEPDEFYAQVEEALLAGGFRRVGGADVMRREHGRAPSA